MALALARSFIRHRGLSNEEPLRRDPFRVEGCCAGAEVDRAQCQASGCIEPPRPVRSCSDYGVFNSSITPCALARLSSNDLRCLDVSLVLCEIWNAAELDPGGGMFRRFFAGAITIDSALSQQPRPRARQICENDDGSFHLHQFQGPVVFASQSRLRHGALVASSGNKLRSANVGARLGH